MSYTDKTLRLYPLCCGTLRYGPDFLYGRARHPKRHTGCIFHHADDRTLDRSLSEGSIKAAMIRHFTTAAGVYLNNKKQPCYHITDLPQIHVTTYLVFSFEIEFS